MIVTRSFGRESAARSRIFTECFRVVTSWHSDPGVSVRHLVVALAVLGFVTAGAASACAVRPKAGATSSTVAIDIRVGDLIDRAAAARTQGAQQRAFEELERLGCAAVPAIISRMDDRRALHVPYIALANKSPQAFEAIRQYRVQRQPELWGGVN
jgi:hypothetical protein